MKMTRTPKYNINLFTNHHVIFIHNQSCCTITLLKKPTIHRFSMIPPMLVTRILRRWSNLLFSLSLAEYLHVSCDVQNALLLCSRAVKESMVAEATNPQPMTIHTTFDLFFFTPFLPLSPFLCFALCSTTCFCNLHKAVHISLLYPVIHFTFCYHTNRFIHDDDDGGLVVFCIQVSQMQHYARGLGRHQQHQESLNNLVESGNQNIHPLPILQACSNCQVGKHVWGLSMEGQGGLQTCIL